jgi:hypothetical protein
MMKRNVQRSFTRSILDFLRWGLEGRGAAVVATAALALFGLSCGGNLSRSPDAANCANVGCALPPMCGIGCQAPCGCCPCVPGSREGDLLCLDQGCYVTLPPTDAGTDVGTDGGWAPPTVCALPFDSGSCRAASPVYAFVNGSCVERVYGGCEGNENRFASFEECLATCAGQPPLGACLPNRVEKEICFACGPAGGCAKKGTVCALVCEGAGDAACEPGLPTCLDGVCQVAGCI